MFYNPYDLIQMVVNGKATYGRPVEYDSQIKNQKTMKNAFGYFVKPIKVVTSCPDCGQGLSINVRLSDPPFMPVKYSCSICNPPPEAPVDPFVNPLETGRVALTELDPLLHNPDKPLQQIEGSVVERFEIPAEAPPVVQETLENILSSDDLTQPEAPKKTQSGGSRIFPLEPAEGLSEEADFDDSSMVDDDE